ncbi:MAG TPA: hypothetical protein VJO54_00895 [Burkholderiales bacterium]|nr:hypothetical protein [Burkholderiales bacterium]
MRKPRPWIVGALAAAAAAALAQPHLMQARLAGPIAPARSTR